ncbi:hypothetical protein H2248_012033 [Termitomyces sp. 'cryptogamus']|nr:hypothetical protein H2248_012033 [Termitomyces sp. 'cryptogamus']
MLKFKLVLAAAILCPSGTFATTLTLFRALPDTTTTYLPVYSPLLSATIQGPIGTGTNGMTTYLEEAVISGWVVVEPIQTQSDGKFVPTTTFSTRTRTDIMVPSTVTNTFAADATHYVYHDDPAPSGDPQPHLGVDEDCVFDGKSVTCVYRWIDSETQTQTGTYLATTYLATIAADSRGNNAILGAGFAKGSSIAWGIFTAGVLSAWVLLL